MRALTRSVCAFTLAFAACLAFLSGVPARAAEPLKIGYSDWPGFTAWEIAAHKGWFKEAGVDVEMVWFEYGPSVEAFAAGKVDGVTIVCGDSLPTGANGKPSTVIVLEDYSDGNDMIIGGPGVKSIKDLKGKKIGVEFNLVDHLLLLKALEANGMSEADVELVNVPTNETPQALGTGGVAAIAAWYPVSGQALNQVAGSKALFTSADAKGLIYDGLHVSKESLSARRDDWKKVVGVWFRCAEFLEDPKTRDEGIRIMAARVSVDPGAYARSMKGTHFLGREANLKHYVKSDSLESVYGSMKMADAFNVKTGVYAEPQDVASYIDMSLVKEVAAGAKKKR
jgi:NitT/TauT family transport system substrate-binding protein